jgi:hypothetical protein
MVGWRSLAALPPLALLLVMEVVRCVPVLVCYWRGLFFFARGGSYTNCPVLRKDQHAKAHLYSMVLTFYLWDEPHYRAGTYKEDLRDNLKNVAVPGTGLPMSFWVRAKPLGYLFCFITNPILCFCIAALRCGLEWEQWRAFHEEFLQLLLHPTDWFTLWRMNCSLATFHSSLLNVPGYRMENKWVFLKAGGESGIPVTPWHPVRSLAISRSQPTSLYHPTQQFEGVTHGGDWIIQERVTNSPFLKQFLPSDAPLSTFRIVTGWELQDSSDSEGQEPQENSVDRVIPFCCVLRAGLSRAETDHVSILFDVDMETGEVRQGTTNNHWYRVGLSQVGQRPWTSYHNVTSHPDSKKAVTGRVVEDIDKMVQLCRTAHAQLLPKVPMAGWDVAQTDDGSLNLLEVNLSCNFFRGAVDLPRYFAFLDRYFAFLSVRYQFARTAHAARN